MYATASSSRLRIKRLVLSALMLALAYVLPFFTGKIPQIGSMLLPMHLPVLLCGFLCGGPWGALVGFIAPLMRSVLTCLEANSQKKGQHGLKEASALKGNITRSQG